MILINLYQIASILTLTAPLFATKTLEEVRAELLVFEDVIINATSTRLALLQQTSDEKDLIKQSLASEHSFFDAPPSPVFYGSNTNSPPYLFYESDTNGDFGSHETIIKSTIFDFASKHFEELPPSDFKTRFTRASVSSSLLSLSAKRVAMGIDVAKAKLVKTPTLASLDSPDQIREMLTNKTQEELVRGRVRSKTASFGSKFDAVALFDILIDITTDVEVAYVLTHGNKAC